jgi:hypothetical protein
MQCEKRNFDNYKTNQISEMKLYDYASSLNINEKM